MLEQEIESHGRLLARLVRDVLAANGGPFDCYADLTDALKGHCARLRVRYSDDDINAAYRLVESNTPLVRPPAALERHPAPSRAPVKDQPIDHAFAKRFLVDDLGFKVRAVPAAKWSDPDAAERAEEAARERALEMEVEL